MATDDQKEEIQSHEYPSLADLARKILLAGIGAAALAQEEAEAFINKLIEKGELAEKDGAGILKDLREKRKGKAKEEFDKLIQSIIQRMDVPTKKDFQVLSDKISELAQKIESLESH